MNSALLLCFLIVLANSKLSKLGFKSLLNLNSFIEDDNYDYQKDICKSRWESKTACHSIPINSEYFNCCYVTEMYDIEWDSECDVIPKPLKDFQFLMDNTQFKAIYRELLGFKEVYDEKNDHRKNIESMLHLK